MTPVGVIRNPRSQRNRRRCSDVLTPGGRALLIAEPASPAALAQALSDFAAAGVEHLVVDGGDGTLREVLTRLPAVFGARLPSVSLIASGNANLAAADVGAFRHGAHALGQLLATLDAATSARRSTRQVIEARWPDGSHPPVFGFFIGGAGYRRGWQLAHRELIANGIFHRWAVAGALIRAAWQILTGKRNSVWQRGSPMTLSVDGAPPRTGARFIFLATGLHSLMLGLWPFWNPSGLLDRPGRLHWLDIAAPAPRFGAALWALLHGRPKPWMLDGDAYRSGDAQSVLITMSEDLIIDGEAYAPDSQGQIELRSGPAFTFLAP